jgi:hypothetical protein
MALISALLSIGFGILASIIPAVTGGSDGLSIWGVFSFGVAGYLIGGSIFAAFWAIVGQTPGMRFLSIHPSGGASRRPLRRRRRPRVCDD